jgi:hypothetical protein
MTVSKQVNAGKVRNVEMYVVPFNGIISSIKIEDGNNTTSFHLPHSQIKVLIEVLQRQLKGEF